MLKIENAFLLDICLGYPFGKIWFPAGMPEVKPEYIPDTFILKGEQLAAVKVLVEHNDSMIERVVEGLRAKADSLLVMPNPSVVQKPSVPESTQRNDYCSLAKYWWPNPETADGMPYIVRDGEINPECYSVLYDVNRLDSFSEASFILSVAAFITGDSIYAAKSVSLINTWIINPTTHQSPHFRFAQLIPGNDKVRFQGLIEARRLIYVCEALQLLHHIGAISGNDYSDCKNWYGELLHWFETSPQGQEARKQKNNIGFWTDLQMLIYARFCERLDLVDNIVRNSVLPRIDEQIDKDGKLCSELSRAKPYDYVAFTLLAMAGLSAATSHGEIQLADYSTEEGRSFQNAFNWFAETIHANGLQESAFALCQVADFQRQLTQLKLEKSALEQELVHSHEEGWHIFSKKNQYSTNNNLLLPDSAPGDAAPCSDELKSALQRVLDRLQRSEEECNSLHSELNEYFRSLMFEAVRYRGLNFMFNKQADSIKKMEEQLKTSLQTQQELRKQLENMTQLREEVFYCKKEFDSVKSELEIEREQIKKLLAELKEVDTSYQKTKKELNAILQSTTWRCTFPMRKAIDILKRIIVKYGKSKPADNKKSVPCKKSKQPLKTKLKYANYYNVHPVKLMRSVKPKNIESLKSEHIEKGLDRELDNFVLYRIIGNDLYPRHKKGQSRENLQFILEHEPELEKCEKRWVINRIIDKDEEKAIIDLLNYHNQQFVHIPFKSEEYKKIGLDIDCLPEPGFLAGKSFENLNSEQKGQVTAAIYRLKNNYVMNNNGARNTALRDGRKRAKWVLPWDGNCFVTSAAWESIRNDVISAPYLKYFAVPMARVASNSQLLSEKFDPDPVEEPQLIFRTDSTEEFNEEFCYGRRPKVELFWRLGIPGKWDKWKDEPWDLRRRTSSKEAKQFGVAGWVARLFSGMKELEQDTKESFKQRGLARVESIVTTLRYLDVKVSDVSPEILTSYRLDVLKQEVEKHRSGADPLLNEIIKRLIKDAEDALTRGPYSVTDKTTLPPSSNKNDYWHPAPYWWPNPNKPDGLPYIQRDGERVPGTRMYEPDSNKYDRTRLQRVMDDSIILALACLFTGEKKFAEHGAKILESFFVEPSRRMNPHLKYAQVRMGHNNNYGVSTGIIELKDMYYYLDAVRILNSTGAISVHNLNGFKEWLSDYLKWLLDSPQGNKERKAANNHGTYYDLQVAAISAFLNEQNILYETLARAQSRIPKQFAPDGSQPEELNRKTTAHYCCFNFQGWVNLAQIASRWGVEFWNYSAPSGANLNKGAQWLLSYVGKDWPFEQINKFDAERFYPIWFEAAMHSVRLSSNALLPESIYLVKPKFFPHDGIKPYWNLGTQRNLQYQNDYKPKLESPVPKPEGYNPYPNSVRPAICSSGSVISDKLLYNDRAVKFLGFGFDFKLDAFNKVVDMLEDNMGGSYNEQQQNIINNTINDNRYDDNYRIDVLERALTDSVREAIAGIAKVRIGITGGMDSRLLYAILRNILPSENVFPYTFGYPGQYDYEFIKKYGSGFLKSHTFLETSSITWDMSNEVKKRKTLGRPGTFNSKSNLFKLLDSMGLPKYNIHGFMGDSLSGGSRPPAEMPVETWDDAVQRFIQKNDRFKLQQIFTNTIDIKSYLPPEPVKNIHSLDRYDLLDYGLRQYQRIFVDSKGGSKTITPYTNKKWIGALLSSGRLSERERLYFKLIRCKFPDVFPELFEENIVCRKEHKKFREKIMSKAISRIKKADLRNPDGTKFIMQVLSDSGKVLPGRQFCEWAEFNNNDSFKEFFSELFIGLRERQIFSEDFLDGIYTKFLSGSRTACEQMKGFVNLELNIRAGTISL